MSVFLLKRRFEGVNWPSDRLKRESLLVRGKMAIRQLNKGHELIFGLFSDYERRSRPSLLKSVVRIKPCKEKEKTIFLYLKSVTFEYTLKKQIKTLE